MDSFGRSTNPVESCSGCVAGLVFLAAVVGLVGAVGSWIVTAGVGGILQAIPGVLMIATLGALAAAFVAAVVWWVQWSEGSIGRSLQADAIRRKRRSDDHYEKLVAQACEAARRGVSLADFMRSMGLCQPDAVQLLVRCPASFDERAAALKEQDVDTVAKLVGHMLQRDRREGVRILESLDSATRTSVELRFPHPSSPSPCASSEAGDHAPGHGGAPPP